MSRVGFVGTGHIAAPMARGLARDGHDVTVSERSADISGALKKAGLGIEVADNQAVLDAADTVFLCLRPAVWQEVVAPLTFRADHRIVSVMAGIALGDLAEACAPATEISSTIPYGFIEFGGCPLPVVGNPQAVSDLFGEANHVLPLSRESALTSYFAASALASAALGLLEATAGWLGRETGDQASAELYVSKLIGGLLTHGDFSDAGALAREKWALATPNTLNRQMVDGVEGQGAFDSLPAVLSRIAASMEQDT